MKLICWNMAGAYGYKRDRHARAWQWLNEQDADVALLQEVVPHPEEMGAWGSLIFRGKYQQHGCAVLVKAGGYRAWEPTDQEPWLKRVGGAAVIARPEQESGLWFISVHSDASSFEHINRDYPKWYADLPPRDQIPRCSPSEMWEIEPIAAELRPVLNGSRFILGGDLNSARMFDTGDSGENARLFDNLHAQGYIDTRPRHSSEEVRTFFKKRTRPLQLDHVFADDLTEASVVSWRVLREAPELLELSDHAPIEVVIA